MEKQQVSTTNDKYIDVYNDAYKALTSDCEGNENSKLGGLFGAKPQKESTEAEVIEMKRC